MRKRKAIGVAHKNILLRPSQLDTAAPPGNIEGAVDTLEQIRQSIARQTRLTSLIAAPWLVFPPDGESFHNAGGITIPAMGAGFTTILSITVPRGRNGVLNRLANAFYGVFQNFSGDLIWRLVRNPGSAIVAAERNYEAIIAVLGLTENPVEIAPIRIFENDVIALQINNTALPAAGQECGAVLGGWYYPRTWDDEFELSRSAQKSVSW